MCSCDGGDGSIGGVISPSWWRDWGRHSLNTAQSSPALSPANTSLQSRLHNTRTARHSDGDKVMRTLLPSDYAVMVDYKIIQAGPPLVITYLLSLNSRGLGERGGPPSPDNL